MDEDGPGENDRELPLCAPDALLGLLRDGAFMSVETELCKLHVRWIVHHVEYKTVPIVSKTEPEQVSRRIRTLE